MDIIAVWNKEAKQRLTDASPIWLQILQRSIPEAVWDKWGEASQAMLKSWRSLLRCELATCVCFVRAYKLSVLSNKLHTPAHKIKTFEGNSPMLVATTELPTLLTPSMAMHLWPVCGWRRGTDKMKAGVCGGRHNPWGSLKARNLQRKMCATVSCCFHAQTKDQDMMTICELWTDFSLKF